MSEALELHKKDQEKIKVGSLIEGPARRDAIHVAVAPAVAIEELVPGQRVHGWKVGTIVQVCRIHGDEKSIGVVDPFLKEPVKRGDTFWVFINPGDITSLKHSWGHPELGEEDLEYIDYEYDECRGCD